MIERTSLVRAIEPHGLLSVGDSLVCYQSHHHSLFLDQSIVDALGGDAWSVRRKAAFDASLALLSSLQGELGVTGEKERLDLASELFSAMGHGRITFELTNEGGAAQAEALHFGSSFAEKYGGLVKNRRVLDAFAAGFCAAAATLAIPAEARVFDAAELACVGRRDPHCMFSLVRRVAEPPAALPLTRSGAQSMPSRLPDDGARAPRTLVDDPVVRLLASSDADGSGVRRAFGVRLALVPAWYTNQITHETAQLIERRSPDLIAVFTALAREAALMGAFHLMTGLLWALGAVPRDPRERLERLLEIAAALGWGALYADEFVPGRTLVLKSPISHEIAYHTAHRGGELKARLAFQQGIALAIMQILHRVDFTAGPPRLTRDIYNALFRGGTRFLVEETRSPLRGDDYSEVLVEAIAD